MEHLESENVKEVYEAIAGHFSQTRYKAWPVVDRFFTQLKPSSVGLDVGCGNGKNMRIRPDTTCIGFDLYFPFEYALLIFIFRCWNLLEIVDMHDLEAVYGNMLTLPFRKISFVHREFPFTYLLFDRILPFQSLLYTISLQTKGGSMP